MEGRGTIGTIGSHSKVLLFKRRSYQMLSYRLVVCSGRLSSETQNAVHYCNVKESLCHNA